MKATVLSDNIPAENLGCEWGLSIFIKKSISVVQRILCGMCQQSYASTYDR